MSPRSDAPSRRRAGRTTALAAAVACAWVALAPPAAAQPQPAQQAVLERLLRTGYDLRRRGQDEAALDAFREAFTLSQQPRVAAQLGLAEQAVGLWVAAEEHLQQALASSTDRWVQRNRSVLVDALEVVQDQLAFLEVRVRPAGAQVTINGERMGEASSSGAFRVAAGVVRVEVAAEGFHSMTRSVDVPARSTMRETIELRPVEPAPPPPAPPPAPAPTRAQVPPPAPRVVRPRRYAVRPEWTAARTGAVVALGATGGASAVLGVTALVVREGLAVRFNTRGATPECPPPSPMVPLPNECVAIQRAEGAWAVTAGVALGAAVALAATALIVGLTAPRVRVPVAVLVAPDGFLLAFRTPE